MSTPDLSIIIATCNRADLLQAALAAVQHTTQCRYEIIAVDGASADHTPAVLAATKDTLGDRLNIIHETQREGFVRAANKGFRAATGRHVIWLNDDARPLPHALDLAVEQLDASPPTVGLLALFHRCDAERNIAYQTVHAGQPFKLLHVRGTLYANFGLGRRATFEKLDYFDEGYFLNAADPDFSLKVWHAGLQVVPAFRSLMDHDEHQDPRRSDDSPRAAADNARLFSKWKLPEKSTFNNFSPLSPCTLQP